MNNGKPDPLDGIDEYLAGIYEVLRQHQQTLFELTIDTQAAIAVLKERAPQFPESFELCRTKALEAAKDAQTLQLRVLDATIARLRGT